MRLIDADALLQSTLYNPLHPPYITDSDIKNAPTIKQELVRCKDCKYWSKEHDQNCMIKQGWFPVKPDWFCADGEPKD